VAERWNGGRGRCRSGTANDATVLAASTTLAATRADIDRAAEADKLKTIHDSYIE
jgi:hypothetical protein